MERAIKIDFITGGTRTIKGLSEAQVREIAEASGSKFTISEVKLATGEEMINMVRAIVHEDYSDTFIKSDLNQQDIMTIVSDTAKLMIDNLDLKNEKSIFDDDIESLQMRLNFIDEIFNKLNKTENKIKSQLNKLKLEEEMSDKN